MRASVPSPSPEYSDSLDSTLTCSHCSNAANDYNLNQAIGGFGFSGVRSREDSPCHAVELAGRLRHSLSVASAVNAEPTDENDVGEDARRDASSDDMPITPRRTACSLFTRSCRALGQDCLGRNKSPDIRNPTLNFKYIQSAKGTWTYNF